MEWIYITSLFLFFSFGFCFALFQHNPLEQMCSNMTSLRLTWPQITAHNVSGALPSNNNRASSSHGWLICITLTAPQTERAAAFVGNERSYSSGGRQHSYEMPHRIWALCWDTGVARLCGNYTVMKKLLLTMACLIWPPHPFSIMLGHRESSPLNGALPWIYVCPVLLSEWFSVYLVRGAKLHCGSFTAQCGCCGSVIVDVFRGQRMQLCNETFSDWKFYSRL